MDELENLPEMRYNDVENFERFADLVRVTVVKLKAENRHAELGESTLHSRLVKKLPARNLECYSRWLSVNNKDPAVNSLSDWLKEEVAIRVEAKEMSHGLDDKPPPEQRFPRRKIDDRRPRAFYTGKDGEDQSQGRTRELDGRMKKPPCVFCGQDNHGIWNYPKFQHMNVGDRWKVAKEKCLCF